MSTMMQCYNEPPVGFPVLDRSLAVCAPADLSPGNVTIEGVTFFSRNAVI